MDDKSAMDGKQGSRFLCRFGTRHYFSPWHRFRRRRRSRRRGVEVGFTTPLAAAWRLDLVYTYLDATFQSSFGGCDGPQGCSVRRGTRLPGVPRQWFSSSLRWGLDSGWHAGLRLDANDRVSADDPGTLHAGGYLTTAVDAGYILDTTQYQLAPYVRVDNVFNRKYVSSVAVNERSGASFNPAPDRSFWLGVRMTLKR